MEGVKKSKHFADIVVRSSQRASHTFSKVLGHVELPGEIRLRPGEDVHAAEGGEVEDGLALHVREAVHGEPPHEVSGEVDALALGVGKEGPSPGLLSPVGGNHPDQHVEPARIDRWNYQIPRFDLLPSHGGLDLGDCPVYLAFGDLQRRVGEVHQLRVVLCKSLPQVDEVLCGAQSLLRSLQVLKRQMILWIT